MTIRIHHTRSGVLLAIFSVLIGHGDATRQVESSSFLGDVVWQGAANNGGRPPL